MRRLICIFIVRIEHKTGFLMTWSYLSFHVIKQQDIVSLHFFGFTARQDYFTHFEPSQSLGRAKTEDPREKQHDHPQADLGFSHMWSELGSNPQRWDDERFRALKISALNLSATGVATTFITTDLFWLIPKCNFHTVIKDCNEKLCQLMRLWYLSHRRPAKASLLIRAVSPEPSPFAHMKYGSRRRFRPKIRHLAPLDGCACVV